MANLPKKKILDTEGNEVLPITHVSAVYDDNGTSVETLLTNMDEEIKNKIIEGYYSNGNFYTTSPIIHDYVEINGVKWATMNLGALSETDYGLYFQWGDTQGYTAEQGKYFGWPDYEYGNGISDPDDTDMTKYNSTDGKTVLEASDDAARANWGDGWRMPTASEFQILGEAVTATWTDDYQDSGIAGMICVDKTDNSKILFFPACGYCNNGSIHDVNSYGGYWSSSLNSMIVQSAYRLSFASDIEDDGVTWKGSNYRYSGFPVRGIWDGPIPTVIIPITDAIYIDKATNTQYRWDGTAYVQLTKLTYTVAEEDIEDADETIISQALRKTSQSLTSSEKAQVLTNLGISDLISGSLQKTTQVLNSAEKTLVLTNLGIPSAKNIIISTSEPTSSDGNNGDIWLVYETQ